MKIVLFMPFIAKEKPPLARRIELARSSQFGYWYKFCFRVVAQLWQSAVLDAGVAGSNPVDPTIHHQSMIHACPSQEESKVFSAHEEEQIQRGDIEGYFEETLL